MKSSVDSVFITKQAIRSSTEWPGIYLNRQAPKIAWHSGDESHIRFCSVPALLVGVDDAICMVLSWPSLLALDLYLNFQLFVEGSVVPRKEGWSLEPVWFSLKSVFGEAEFPSLENSIKN